MSGMMMAAAGSGGDTVNITDKVITDTEFSPAVAYAGYRLTTAGLEQTSNSGTYSGGSQAISPSTSTSKYEVRATLNSGALTVGSSATGSWLALTSTRTWYCEDSSGSVTTADLAIEVRNATTLVVMDSCSVSLSAEQIVL